MSTSSSSSSSSPSLTYHQQFEYCLWTYLTWFVVSILIYGVLFPRIGHWLRNEVTNDALQWWRKNREWFYSWVGRYQVLPVIILQFIVLLPLLIWHIHMTITNMKEPVKAITLAMIPESMYKLQMVSTTNCVDSSWWIDAQTYICKLNIHIRFGCMHMYPLQDVLNAKENIFKIWGVCMFLFIFVHTFIWWLHRMTRIQAHWDIHLFIGLFVAWVTFAFSHVYSSFSPPLHARTSRM